MFFCACTLKCRAFLCISYYFVVFMLGILDSNIIDPHVLSIFITFKAILLTISVYFVVAFLLGMFMIRFDMIYLKF